MVAISALVLSAADNGQVKSLLAGASGSIHRIWPDMDHLWFATFWDSSEHCKFCGGPGYSSIPGWAELSALSVLFIDPAEVIETRRNEQAGGRQEYYVHYEGCELLLSFGPQRILLEILEDEPNFITSVYID